MDDSKEIIETSLTLNQDAHVGIPGSCECTTHGLVLEQASEQRLTKKLETFPPSRRACDVGEVTGGLPFARRHDSMIT